VTLVAVDALLLALAAVPHVRVADTDAPVLRDPLRDAATTALGVGLGVLGDELLDQLPLLFERSGAELFRELSLEPFAERSDLREELLERALLRLRVIPVDVEPGLDARGGDDGDASLQRHLGERSPGQLRRRTHHVLRRAPDQVEAVFDPSRAPKRA